MKTPVLINKIFVVLVALICSVLSAFSADRYSIATGNWNATSTWSATSGGASGASFPVAGDNVFIEGGYSVSVNIASGCTNLTIVNGSTLNVQGFNFTVNGTTKVNGTISHTSMTGSKIFIGLVTVNASGIWNNNTVNESITLRGGITNNGTFNAGTGNYTFNTNNQALTGTFLIPNVLVTGVTLLSSQAETALIAGSGTGDIMGNVTMHRYLSPGYGYKYFSSPFHAPKVNEFGDDMDPGASFTTFYRYDENRIVSGIPVSGWVSYKTTTNILNPLAGYAVNFGLNPAAKTIDIKGEVNNGDLSVTLYNHNNTYTKGFNLIGNPYPSPIDWDASSGWTKTGIDNTLYYFKASNTDQYGGTYSTYLDGVSSDNLASNIIPSMQRFFVHVSVGEWPVSEQLAMNNNVRVTNQSQTFIKGQRSASLLRITASFSNNLSSPDYSVVYFDQKATNAFDGQLDAIKLMNTDLSVPNVYVLTPDNEKISIKALPYASDTIYNVPLGLKINKAGDVIFKIRDIEGSFAEMSISLIDKMIGKEQDLLNNQEYKISLIVGEYENRFFLNFSNIGTGIDDTWKETDIFSIYCSHGILKAEINSFSGKDGTLNIFNLIGQILFIKKVYQPGYHEFNPGLKDGLYIVSYISGTKRCSKKYLSIINEN